MFLKAYTSLSDRKLVDFKFVSKIRTELSSKLRLNETQYTLARAWKPYIKQPNVVLEDATCYESYIRYPTNVKLLWECVDWMYDQLKLTCKYLKIPTPRTQGYKL